jgi:hypothetical protein
MQIVLNHVTRFTGTRICIAGVELAELKHVRPTTPSSDLITRELLSDEGGPVQIGALIEIGDAAPDPSAPETEDHLFATSDAELVELVDGDTYLELLKSISDPDVQSAFGRARKVLQIAGSQIGRTAPRYPWFPVVPARLRAWRRRHVLSPSFVRRRVQTGFMRPTRLLMTTPPRPRLAGR